MPISIRVGALPRYKEPETTSMALDDVIDLLHRRGLTIMESAKFLIQTRGMTLADAKSSVSRHPVWAPTVRAHGPLHDALIASLQRDARPSKRSPRTKSRATPRANGRTRRGHPHSTVV